MEENNKRISKKCNVRTWNEFVCVRRENNGRGL